jgi:hypothetical protein
MTKELFGDAELRTKDQQREKKEKKEKKGSILGRLFGA